MPETEPKPKTVRQVIDSFLTDKPPVEADALAVPAFSSGTRAVDPAANEAVETQTPFTDGHLPVDTKTADGPAVRTPADLLAEHRQRLESAATEPPATPAPADAAAAAVEAAVEDIWGDVEDFEFDDPDLEVKIPIRVPKKFAETAKRGYGRRAKLDREIRYLGEASPVLRPLIEDGRINRILPLIQRALSDPAYGEFVWGAYQRASQGLPLAEQARIEAAAAGAAAAPTPPTLEGELLEGIDPIFAPSLAPVLQRLNATEQRQREWEAERQATVARDQEQQRLRQWQNGQLQAAHHDLARMMPNEYTGVLTSDQQRWNRVMAFANENGYVNDYGLRAGVVFAAQYLYQQDQERLALTASPAATALQRVEAQQLDAAGREAAASARTVSGGGVAAPPPPPAPLGPPPTKRADGKMRSPEDYMRDVQRSLATR